MNMKKEILEKACEQYASLNPWDQDTGMDVAVRRAFPELPAMVQADIVEAADKYLEDVYFPRLHRADARAHGEVELGRFWRKVAAKKAQVAASAKAKAEAEQALVAIQRLYPDMELPNGQTIRVDIPWGENTQWAIRVMAKRVRPGEGGLIVGEKFANTVDFMSKHGQTSPGSIVVMNEQHTLLPEQTALLPDGYTIANVPATGWDLDTIRQKSQEWGDRMVILVSPIPALMSIRSKGGLPFQVFHNDRREKKELPDGRIIHTVAKEGWQLV